MDFQEKVNYYNQIKIDLRNRTDATLAKVRLRNEEYDKVANTEQEVHPTAEPTKVIVYDSVNYNPAIYVLGYLLPDRKNRKKK